MSKPTRAVQVWISKCWRCPDCVRHTRPVFHTCGLTKRNVNIQRIPNWCPKLVDKPEE